LNEAVYWRFSNFNQMLAPVIADSVRECSVGVRTTSEPSAAAASTTSASVTGSVARGPDRLRTL